jgi:hypothetical protein
MAASKSPYVSPGLLPEQASSFRLPTPPFAAAVCTQQSPLLAGTGALQYVLSADAVVGAE